MLQVRDLSVVYSREGKAIRGIEDVSFSLREGSKLAIVGESGSGKTTTARALCGMIGAPASIDGQIIFEDEDITHISRRRRSELMGKSIAYVPQEARASLNPRLTIGRQLVEMASRHLDLSRKDARSVSLDGVRAVQIPDPEKVLASYPHQLSGGMCQRVVIAMALLCRPQLVVADEPTASLDATLARKVIALLQDATDEIGCSVVLVTHNLLQAADFADTVLVMYGGQVVEMGPAETVLSNPRMPYTAALLRCVPRIGDTTSMQPIPGHYAARVDLAECIFEPRCVRSQSDCLSERPLLTGSESHSWRCFHPIEHGTFA